MKKKYFLCCFIILIFLCGCKKTDILNKEETVPVSKETDAQIKEEEIIEEEIKNQTVTKIDWSDFIKYFDQDYENNHTVVPDGEIDCEIGEIKGNPPSEIEGSEYITQNGEAGWLPVGTKLYSIKNLDSLNYIAAYFEGQYIFYKTVDSEEVTFKNTQEKKPLKKVTKEERIFLTQTAGFESIYKLPKEYNISMASENGDYVFLYDSTINSEKIIDFLTNVGNKEPAMIRKVMMTIEGDLIITDYIYNGESFRVVMDDTRDKFAEKPQRKEKNFANVLVREEESGKYIVLTNENTEEDKKDVTTLLNEQETEEYDGVHLLKLSEK